MKKLVLFAALLAGLVACAPDYGPLTTTEQPEGVIIPAEATARAAGASQERGRFVVIAPWRDSEDDLSGACVGTDRQHVNLVEGYGVIFRQAGPDENEPEYVCIHNDTPPELVPPARRFEEFQPGVKWFCQYSPCLAGIYRHVDVVPGEECVARATVTAISSRHTSQHTDLYKFVDGGAATRFPVWIMGHSDDPDPLARGRVLQSYTPDIYFAQSEAEAAEQGFTERGILEYAFTPTGSQATVGIASVWRFGERFQDTFVGRIDIECAEGGGDATETPQPTQTTTSPPTETPSPPVLATETPDITPSATPTAEPTAEPTETPAPTLEPGEFSCEVGQEVWGNDWLFYPQVQPLNVRSGPSLTESIVSQVFIDEGGSYLVVCVLTPEEGERWVKIAGVRSGQYIYGWSASLLDGFPYGVIDYGE